MVGCFYICSSWAADSWIREIPITCWWAVLILQPNGMRAPNGIVIELSVWLKVDYVEKHAPIANWGFQSQQFGRYVLLRPLLMSRHGKDVMWPRPPNNCTNWKWEYGDISKYRTNLTRGHKKTHNPCILRSFGFSFRLWQNGSNTILHGTSST